MANAVSDDVIIGGEGLEPDDEGGRGSPKWHIN